MAFAPEPGLSIISSTWVRPTYQEM
jgi:hypothetical protein